MLQSVQENISTCLIKEKYLLRSCPKMGINILQRLGNFPQDVLQLLMRYIMTYKIFLETLHVCLRNIKIILCWFSNLSNADIVALQKALNKIPGFDKLTEDGIYGEKTSRVLENLIDMLVNGSIPTLGFIDPLQSHITGITVGASKAGAAEGLTNALMLGNWPYIRFDPPHNGRIGYFRGEKISIDFPHINLDAIKNAPGIYNWVQSRYNHYKISDEAYDALKNLSKTGKIVRIGGRVLLVVGVIADVLEIREAIRADLGDADQKLGKTTLSAIASVGGSWAGAFGGAKIGALAGAMTGPAAPIAIPVLGIIGGALGALGGELAAEWVVDITCLEGE